MVRTITGIFASILMFACNSPKREANNNADQQERAKEVVVNFEAKSESTLKGEAVFTSSSNTDYVTLKVSVSGISPGLHGIHIHEVCDCSSPDGKSAGGHWNPTNDKHGHLASHQHENDEGHKGDIGNISVDENGIGTLEFKTKEWCIDCEDETKNIIGHSVIIHQGIDDMKSQPSGKAGPRIGCGMIEIRS